MPENIVSINSILNLKFDESLKSILKMIFITQVSIPDIYLTIFKQVR